MEKEDESEALEEVDCDNGDIPTKIEDEDSDNTQAKVIPTSIITPQKAESKSTIQTDKDKPTKMENSPPQSEPMSAEEEEQHHPSEDEIVEYESHILPTKSNSNGVRKATAQPD